MTSPDSIRTVLTGLWDTGANAYELAQAVMQAVDIESADLEIEVESVISRALTARELIDLGKVAAEVAKLLPGVVEPLTIANLKAAIRTGYVQRGPHGCFDFDEEQAAQAVMRLLKKE